MKITDDHSRETRGGGERREPLGERPRVVIFEGAPEPLVKVVELPEPMPRGSRFCHSGIRWEVTATRTGERVLIARPAQS
jgi:hypothetical protein